MKHWVQQNHDSLPQKAGYPQHALNEIHGSLHDPANPVVPYEGSLRDDLFDWLVEWEKQSDLCLALGTSLSGFNVDRVPQTVAVRNRSGIGLGLVIVNLQQTPYDDLCALRIFAKLDEVLDLLAVELGISEQVKPMDHVYRPRPAEGSVIEEDVYWVPFDSQGDPSGGKLMWDLRQGARVKLTGGPYEGDVGEVVAKSETGDYRLRFADSMHPVFGKRRPFSLWLGSWWIEEATHGRGIGGPVGRLPFVNVAAQVPTQQNPPMPLAAVASSRPPVRVVPPPPPPGKGKGKGKGTDEGSAVPSGPTSPAAACVA